MVIVVFYNTSGPSSVKVKVNMLVAQACPLCDPMDCSPPGSSVHGIPQAGILEWVAISFSRGSSQPRDQTQGSCIAGRFFPSELPGKPVFYNISGSCGMEQFNFKETL